MPGRPFTRCWFALIEVVFITAVSFSSATFAAEGAETTIPSAAVADGTTWYRQTSRFSDAARADTILSVSAPGTVSVYLNGQRLARSVDGDDRVLFWRVGALLRPGVNCLAVSVKAKTEGNTGRLTAWYEGFRGALVQNAWKMTSTAPPVGWQKTDFNDRDWKAATVAAFLKSGLAGEKRRELAWTPATGISRFQNGRFQFLDNDHVVMIGGTFIERAQSFGYLEACLAATTGTRHVTFRNLGWSADTVFAESRGIFDSPAKGYERLIEHVRAEEPTVVLLCYGQNEAMTFAPGTSGVERFKTQLATIYHDLSAAGAEVAFLTPHPFMKMAPPLPDPTRWNPRLQEFGEAVRDVASALNAPSIDLFSGFADDLEKTPPTTLTSQVIPDGLSSHPDLSQAQYDAWTDNGMHWNRAGYARIAPILTARLTGSRTAAPAVSVDLSTRQVSATGGTVQNVNWNTDNAAVELQFQANTVTSKPVVIRLKNGAVASEKGYRVIIRSGSAEAGIEPRVISLDDETSLTFAPDRNAQFEELRQLTIRKNELYFHRWRPQNITYLFGFRKHEQGNNASEIAQFDPLIDELEQKIYEVRQPQWQTIIVSRSKDQ